jgi:hypothetical protein
MHAKYGTNKKGPDAKLVFEVAEKEVEMPIVPIQINTRPDPALKPRVGIKREVEEQPEEVTQKPKKTKRKQNEEPTRKSSRLNK